MASSKIITSTATSAIRAAAVNLNSSKLPKEIIKSSTAYLSSAPPGGKHSLPRLPYDYAALEPIISAETMELHHSKHHNTYVTNLNVSLEKLDAAVSASDVSAIIGLQGALKFNGGGHLNHCLFWDNLRPTITAGGGGHGPSEGSPLEALIKERYHNLESLKSEMSASTIAVQGSGWGWLGYNPKSRKLEITTCANQDPLQATTGLVPLIGIDVWEHAYYVDYRNVRPNYVNAIWDLINWEEVEARLAAAMV